MNWSYTKQVFPNPPGNTVLLLGMGKGETIETNQQQIRHVTAELCSDEKHKWSDTRNCTGKPRTAPSSAHTDTQPWGPSPSQGPPYLLSVLGQGWQGDRDVLLAGPDHGLQRQLLHLQGAALVTLGTPLKHQTCQPRHIARALWHSLTFLTQNFGVFYPSVLEKLC